MRGFVEEFNLPDLFYHFPWNVHSPYYFGCPLSTGTVLGCIVVPFSMEVLVSARSFPVCVSHFPRVDDGEEKKLR